MTAEERAAFTGPVAVVDDDPSVRSALVRLLGSVDIRCVSHPSGSDFLSSPDLHEVDCLLLDVHMPGLSGLEVLDEIQHAATKIPVVLMTARYESDFAARAIEAGASAFLRKPFADGELFAAIEEATGSAVLR
ncbi:MAG: response regulator [Gemmatimonadota bacterium]